MKRGDHEQPALRRDAERNRRQLLAAAGEVFQEAGVDASLEEVARRANVGIGTLYRRFPTRSSLIEALFSEKAQEFATLSTHALERDDAWAGFRDLVQWLCEMQAEDRGFSQVICGAWPSAPRLQSQLDEARENAERLVRRAQAQGTLRADFVLGDLIWILLANGAYLQATRGHAPDAWRRYLALVLDALRAPARGGLPAPPSEEQTRLLLRRIGHGIVHD